MTSLIIFCASIFVVCLCATPARAQTRCELDGSTNDSVLSLTYSSTSGKFTGTIVSNGCPDHPYCDNCDPVRYSQTTNINVQIPSQRYTGAGPFAAPLRGAVGYSYSGGVNLYGPMEAGFTLGQICATGSCPAGVDVPLCEDKLSFECGEPVVLTDSYAGHAQPYHYHTDFGRYSTQNNSAVHSELIAVALDGYGVYGLWEGGGSYPSDLDACNGHVGVTPRGSTAVYHYHTSSGVPRVPGCYGPVDSVEECYSLYSTCTTPTFANITTAEGTVYDYILDCPCFPHYSARYEPHSSALLIHS